MPRRHSSVLLVLAAALGAVGGGSPVRADEQESPLAIKLSGFANAVASTDRTRGDDHAAALFDAEIEVSPQYRLNGGTVLAARAAVSYRQTTGSTSSLAIPEVSLFAIGDFGRIEIGNRAGFPQSLIGFTPSEIAFTAAEYGPESGARLDPDGRLPSTLAPPDFAAQIDRLSYLGYAARLYDDRSAKVIYLTPRFRSGLYGALSYTPRTNRPGGYQISGPQRPTRAAFRDVIQAALVWNHRTENVDLSIGATWTHATATDRATLGTTSGHTDSLSGGVTVTVKDRYVFGLSGTIDTPKADPTGRAAGRQPFGVVASFNYVDGPWIAGGYYQHAVAPVDRLPGAYNRLDVAQLGLSYLVDKNHDLLGEGFYTDVKLFVSGTHYQIDHIESGFPRNPRGLTVLLVGARFAFF